MNLTVITPVGHGHEIIVERARQSVVAAERGPFLSVEHVIIDDTRGVLGRSAARNHGIDMARSDWLFFLDSDDRLMPDALTLNDFDAPATFGALCLDGLIPRRNVWPCTWREIARDMTCTLSMGFFCRRDLGMRFNETLDAGEDWEFYLRLPAFVKVKPPLVDIGRSIPSATGPRGYTELDWTAIAKEQVAKAVARNPAKFDFGRDAVLAPA